jgi:tetratricopeptide (TPR) repeat protein
MKLAYRLLALSVALGSGAGAAAPSQSEPSLELLGERYRSGAREEALAELQAWPRTRVWQETERLHRTLQRPQDPGSGDRRAIFAVTALLVEAGIADARQRLERAALEVHAAARLVRLLPVRRGCAECDAFADRFARVAVISLRSWAHIEVAHELALQGVKDFPQDAELWAALGSIVEGVASMRTYEPPPDSRARGRSSVSSPGYTVESDSGVPEREGRLPPASLAEAERHYVRAVMNDPEHHEARLRLGNVRLLRGRAAEALPDLDRVARESPLASERYLARLFEGRGREQLGDIEGAASAYAAAVEAAPLAQTGQLALGRALDLLGEKARAQDALARASVRDEAASDPWWDYLGGKVDRSAYDAHVRRLLEAVR